LFRWFDAGVTPLTIPNREVKPGSSDGTRKGRVANRRNKEFDLLKKPLKLSGFFSNDYCLVFVLEPGYILNMKIPEMLSSQQTEGSSFVVDWKETADGYSNLNISFGDSFVTSVIREVEGENPLAYLHIIQVDSELQKQGIGTRLLENFVSEIKQHGIHRIAANVRSLGGLRTFLKVLPQIRVYKPAGTFLEERRQETELSISEILSKGEEVVDLDIVADI